MPSEVDSFLGVRSTQQQTTVPGQRYPALRIISFVYRILAILTAIGAVIMIITGAGWLHGWGDEGKREGTMFILTGVVGGFFGVISSLAAAEVIRVFLDIEDNTRNTYYTVWSAFNKS